MGRSAELNRTLACCLIFALTVGAGVAALNQPTLWVQVDRREMSALQFMDSSANSNAHVPLEYSGWPLTYRIRSEAPKPESAGGNHAAGGTRAAGAGNERLTPSSPYELFFSWPKLMLNAIVAMALMASVAWVTWARHRHLSGSANANRIRWRYDLATAMACFALPLSLYGISYAKAQRHIRLANDLSADGRIALTSRVPEWMAHRLPKTFHHAFLRLSDAQALRPEAEVFDKLSGVETLRNVSFYAADIDVKALDFIGSSKTLSSLSLINCRISPEALDRIADHQPLRRLALRGCPLTTDDTTVLDRLTRLEMVDLSRTNIVLAELEQPGWSQTVTDLRLTRPPRGKQDTLEIIGWKRLVSLHVRRPELDPNDSPLTLIIRDCPHLKDLHLDRWQKHVLVAENLPALSEIHEPLFESAMDYEIPFSAQMSRWQRIELTNLPSIGSLEFQSEDLKSVQLKGVPNLRQVSIGNSTGESFSGMPLKTGPPLEIGNWLRNISQVPSIERVMIDDAIMGQDEIDQLARLPFLKELRCQRTELKSDEVASLDRNSTLEIIDVHQCVIDQACFNRLTSLPKLKTLNADLSLIENLEIQGLPNLQVVATKPFKHLRTLDIQQLPRFSSALIIQNRIEHLRVIDVPGLQELVVECPWPEDSQVQTIDCLRRFAAGGIGVNDELLEVILQCKDLDQLTMAYPHVSPNQLKRIGELTHLTTLELPGCQIDDSVAASWSSLSRLRRACFDHTQVGAETLRWLSTLESLRSVSLNGVDLRGDAGDELTRVRQLTELSLADAIIAPETIVTLLSQGEIESIDLSRLKVTQPIFDAIQQSKSLTYCVLNGCQLSADRLHDLLAGAPRLHVETCPDGAAIVDATHPKISPADDQTLDPERTANALSAVGQSKGQSKGQSTKQWNQLRHRIHGLPLAGSPQRQFGRHRAMIQVHQTSARPTRNAQPHNTPTEKPFRRPFAVELFRAPRDAGGPAIAEKQPDSQAPPKSTSQPTNSASSPNEPFATMKQEANEPF